MSYAFELLGLERRDDEEIGRGVRGYCEGVAADPRAGAATPSRPGGRIVIVVNDRRGLYEGILADAGLRLEERIARHVNRRTGRRNGEYFEDVLVAVPARRRVRPRAGLTASARRPSSSIFALGRVELADADPVELLAAFPEANGLLEVGAAALELGDDPLELCPRLLEGELGAHSRDLLDARAEARPRRARRRPGSRARPPGRAHDAGRRS